MTFSRANSPVSLCTLLVYTFEQLSVKHYNHVSTFQNRFFVADVLQHFCYESISIQAIRFK